MMNENVLLSQQLEDSKKEMIIKMEEMAVDVNHLKQRLVKSEKEMLEFRMLAQVNERLKTGGIIYCCSYRIARNVWGTKKLTN